MPTITGTAAVGTTLSEKNGTWSNDPSALSLQWEDCNAGGAACTAIPGATAGTYKVAASDGGHTIRVLETATNAGGASRQMASNATAIIPVPASPPAERTAPSIAGAPIIGRRLHGSNGRWTGSTPLRFSGQWQRCRTACTNIAGATGTTYVVRTSDHGFRIRLVVTVRNALGVSSAKSAPTATVVSVQQVRAALQRTIAVHGETIAKLLAHGHVSQVAALVPGRLDVKWMDGGTKIAAGGVTYARPGSRTLRLALTDAGKRILGRARGHVIVTIHGTFAPAGGGAPITARVIVSLT